MKLSKHEKDFLRFLLKTRLIDQLAKDEMYLFEDEIHFVRNLYHKLNELKAIKKRKG